MITQTKMVPLASGGMLPPSGGRGGRTVYPYPSPENRYEHAHHNEISGEQFVDLKLAKKDNNSQLRAEKANRKGK